MLMLCTNNLVRVTVGSIERCNEETNHGAVVICTFTISRSKEGAKRRTFILTETAPLQKRLIITKCQKLFSSNGISVWQFIKNKKQTYAIYYHTVEIT